MENDTYEILMDTLKETKNYYDELTKKNDPEQLCSVGNLIVTISKVLLHLP